jgi:hypothetical protein
MRESSFQKMWASNDQNLSTYYRRQLFSVGLWDTRVYEGLAGSSLRRWIDCFDAIQERFLNAFAIVYFLVSQYWETYWSFCSMFPINGLHNTSHRILYSMFPICFEVFGLTYSHVPNRWSSQNFLDQVMLYPIFYPVVYLSSYYVPIDLPMLLLSCIFMFPFVFANLWGRAHKGIY